MALDVSKLTPEQKQKIAEKLKTLSPEQLQDLIKQQCVFCKIAKGEVEAKTVYEDSSVKAILDAQPANPGHVLIFPKKHYSILPQMPDDEVAKIFAVAKHISAAVFESTGAQGSNIFVASGAVAGQGAPHVIVHVIPRFEKDGLPAQFWEPKEITAAQMDEVGNRIAQELKNVKISSPVPVKVEPKKEAKSTGRRRLPRVKSLIP